MKEKAYKLLAKQENISNSKAKDLIDRGVVYVGTKKVEIARGEVIGETKFRILEIEKPKVIFQDENIIAVSKPPFINSDEIERSFESSKMIHRLDRETSGVMLLAKSDEFLQKCIEEFKKFRVYKEYIALVNGVIAETIVINDPIITTKGHKATSVISKMGKPAETEVEPLEIIGKKTKVKIVIKTGRTHQIRVHLSSIKHPIVGDAKYGTNATSNRVMLHAKKIEIFDYKFEVKEDF